MKLIFAVIWAIPAFYLWNFLAPIYLPQLPPQYLDVPFWHVAGIFALITIVKMMILPHRYHRYYACRFDKFRKFGKFGKFSRHGMSDTYYHR
jgi:hypothetical protein